LFYSLVLTLGSVLSSCKVSGKSASSSNNDKKDKELKERERTLVENFYIDGCRDKIAGKLESAEEKFREAEKIDPKDMAIKYELSTIYKLMERPDEAIRLAKECVDADPKNIWYHLAYIDGLQYKKQFALEAEAYEKVIKYFPERSDLYESMAITYALCHNFTKSFKIYEELEKRYGTNETFTLNKIRLLKEQKKYNEAEGELKKLIQSNPQEPRYYTYLAEYYEDVNDFEKAKATYDKVLSLDPNNPMVHLALASYYKDRNKTEDSHNELRIAFSNPDLEVETKLKILNSYYELSDKYPEYTPKGYELCNIMLKVNPASPESHTIYADFLLRDKKIKEARDQYLIAARLDKSRFAIWNQLLIVEGELNEYDSLEKHSALVMELFPNQPSPFFFNGVSNIFIHDYKKAAQSLNDGLEFVYDNKQLMFQFYRNLGDAYNYLKEYAKSDKAFDDALKVDPDNAELFNIYSFFLSVRKEKLEKAEKFSRRSNELSPNNGIYMDTYGWILFQLGKYKEAEEWLSRAAKKESRRPLILEHYGDVLFKLNKPEEALKLWQQAKEAGGNSDELLKKISLKKLSD